MENIKIPKTVMIARNKLIVDKSNPNILNEHGFEALKKAITKYGFTVPIVTNKDFKIIDGFHHI